MRCKYIIIVKNLDQINQQIYNHYQQYQTGLIKLRNKSIKIENPMLESLLLQVSVSFRKIKSVSLSKIGCYVLLRRRTKEQHWPCFSQSRFMRQLVALHSSNATTSSVKNSRAGSGWLTKLNLDQASYSRLLSTTQNLP